jgi:hypothetical protein
MRQLFKPYYNIFLKIEKKELSFKLHSINTRIPEIKKCEEKMGRTLFKRRQKKNNKSKERIQFSTAKLEKIRHKWYLIRKGSLLRVQAP